MPIPTFDGEQIFSYTDSDSVVKTDGAITFGPYSGIRQTIHFNGADANTYLTHGYSDRTFQFNGCIYNPSEDLSDLQTQLQTIQSYIDDSIATPTESYTLVDNTGTTWSGAQIFTCDVTLTTKADPGWLVTVKITGIVNGQQQDGVGEPS